MNLFNTILALLILFISSTAFAQQPKYYYFFGDGGKLSQSSKQHDDFIHALQNFLKNSSENDVAVFLGDNIYPDGLVKEETERKKAEEILHSQVSLLKNFKGNWFFIPGNHDWHSGKKQGLNTIRQQFKWFKKEYGKNHFFPEDVCPGPEVALENEDSVFIALDTQWWVHPYEKLDESSDCKNHSPHRIEMVLETLLDRYSHKRLIVLGHHPLYSSGRHAGAFSWKDHIFPLRKLNKNIWLPLPGLGSIAPIYLQTAGGRQDIAHPSYQKMKHAFLNQFSKHPGLIYASGHEHLLEHHHRHQQHYIVSGTLSKRTGFFKTKKANYVSNERGFARLKVLSSNKSELQYFEFNADKKQFVQSYTSLVNSVKPILKSKENVNAIHPVNNKQEEQYKTLIPAQSYSAKGIKRALLGSSNRKWWTEEISVPVFHLKQNNAQYSVVKLGGSGQSLSIHLKNQDGKLFKLRSVKKVVNRGIAKELQNTWVSSLLEDQFSGLNPYASMISQKLADALNVYHIRAKLIYFDSTEVQGLYKKEIPSGLYILEDQPKGKNENDPHFGNAKKTLKTAKVLKKIFKDKYVAINQKEVLKARLLDIVLGDWDRHDDQWRWVLGQKDETGLRLARPIALDRDNALHKMNGIVGWTARRKFLFRHYQNFGAKIHDPVSLTLASDSFDRSFISKLHWNEWQSVIKEVQQKLNSETLNDALSVLPKELPKSYTHDIKNNLIQRVKTLEKTAHIIYKAQAKEVRIVGSKWKEKISIRSLGPKDLEVKIFRIEEGNRLSYQRVFDASDTKEIILYARGGNDSIEFLGNHKVPIKLHLLTGKGDDELILTKKDRPLRKVHLYDITQGVQAPKHTMLRKHFESEDKKIHFHRKDHHYPLTVPVLFFQSDPDNGFYIGGGFSHTQYGFNKYPFKSKYNVKANFSFRGTAGNLIINAHHPSISRNLGLKWSINAALPRFRGNFYGLGNNSRLLPGLRNSNSSFYWVTGNQVDAQSLLQLNPSLGFTIAFGPEFRLNSFHTRDNANRLIADQSQNTLSTRENRTLFDSSYYVGPKIQVSLGERQFESRSFTQRVLQLKSNFSLLYGLNKGERTVSQLNSKFNFGGSLAGIKSIYELSLGHGLTRGQWEFFQAQSLGANSGLRGYLANRFSGDQVFYQNFDVKSRWGIFHNAWLPFSYGSHIFMDQGRVWLRGENSDTWRRSYGGALWFAFFQKLNLNIGYAFPESDFSEGLFNVNLGL